MTVLAWQVPARAEQVQDDPELKARFAELLLRWPGEAFKVACMIVGNDTQRAMDIAARWPLDMDVLELQAALIAEQGDEAFLPTKAELARRVFNVGDTATDVKDKLAAFKLYAEIRSFIVKAEVVNNNVINNNRVMVMTDFGSDEQWETKAVKQQSKLIEHSRT